MYFSIQDERQVDSVRERDVEEDVIVGRQWLKQFLFTVNEREE
jgi:hypothetical protein